LVIDPLKFSEMADVQDLECIANIEGKYCDLPKERVRLEDQGQIARIVLKQTFKKRDGALQWIYMAQDRDK
jgi:hypothetical protein